MKLVVEGVVVAALFILALCFETIPITPAYLYPGELAWDFPKRNAQIPPWGFFLAVTLIPTGICFALYFVALRDSMQFAQVWSWALEFVVAVSLASIYCNVFHFVLGVPRHDSAEMCHSTNVTWSQC